MKKLGVITTTYNRAEYLYKLYESLCEQSCHDFKWIVIDDGSQDNTKDIVKSFIEENKIEILYHYHENIGMTASREVGYHIVDTELNMIVDSDDWLDDNAIKMIINFWDKNKSDDVAGIIALNKGENGQLIGTTFPTNLKKSHYKYLKQNKMWGGDKKLIYKSELTRKVSYPKFKGEKYFPPSYKIALIDKEYKMLLMNEIVCIVGEDANERNTYNKINQYKTSPKGFAYYRNMMMTFWTKPSFIAKEALHYIADSLFAKNKRFLNEASRKDYVVIFLPLGIIFYFYLRYTKRASLRHNRK